MCPMLVLADPKALADFPFLLGKNRDWLLSSKGEEGATKCPSIWLDWG